MKQPKIFTLAPSDHPKDPAVLEHGYKIWSTFKSSCNGRRFLIRSNKPDTAGGQKWSVIAERVDGTWHVKSGLGHFSQGGALLARYLIGKRAQIRSEAKPYQGSVRRYAASGTVYSLPSLLNNGQAVVSRDKEADKRQATRKQSLADLMAARGIKRLADAMDKQTEGGA